MVRQEIPALRKVNIAIDGYAGCGKSTLAHDLADALGYTFVDTGAMFRAITLLVIESQDTLELKEKAQKIIEADPRLQFDPKSNDMLINGVNREADIRTNPVASRVSEVASIAVVRNFLKEAQTAMIQEKGVVMEGRDIGTVIMPDAEIKVFITATMERRIQRRLDQLEEMGVKVSVEDVKTNLLSRDRLDTSREIAPLSLAKDAVVVDTSDLSREEQLHAMLALVKPAINKEVLLPFLH